MISLSLGRVLCPALALLVGAPVSASAATSIKVSRVEPSAAVSGAGIDLKGKGLRGNGTRVTIGGKGARILSGSATRMRIVVPNLKPGTHRLVVKRGRSTARARLRVRKPFRGSIGVKRDTTRASTGTIGPAGGEVVAMSADGTRYTLRVPAGALGTGVAITMTPATFSGLPLSGPRAAGVELEPDGLAFATRATLTIEPKRAFRARTAGFTHTGGATGFEVHSITRQGRVLTLPIEHFSSSGVGNVTEADFANLAGPIVNQTGPLTEAQLRYLFTLIGDFSALFDRPPPPDPGYFFCAHQPMCEQAKLRALEFLRLRIESECARGRANPELSALRELRTIIDLDAERGLFGADAEISRDCQRDIVRSLVGQARQVARSAAYAPPLLGPDLPNNVLGDLDGENGTMNFEFLVRLSVNATELGFEDLTKDPATGDPWFREVLRFLPTLGRERCSANNQAGIAGGVADLLLSRRWAELLDPEAILLFENELDFCRIEITVTPPSDTVSAGRQRQFTATASGLIHSGNGAVNWSATGGSITAEGLYTAPSSPGTYEVEATSAVNPARSSTATVTVTAPAIETYSCTTRSCESANSCFPSSAARATLEKSGGMFTLRLNDGTGLPPSNCGAPGSSGGCVQLTGTGDGPTYSGIGKVSGMNRQVTATVSGTTMTARVDFDPPSTPWREYTLTRDP